MKKSLIFWLAAVTCAAWILVGCEQEAETKTVYDKSGTVYGEVSAAKLEAIIDAAVTDGRALELNDVTLPAGSVNLKTASVTIAGTLRLGPNAAINAKDAKVTFAQSATVSGSTGSVIVGDPAVFTATTAPGVVVVEPAAGGTLPATGVTAVENLTLGAAGSIPTGLTVYVYGTLTVDADSVAPSGTVKAIGKVVVTGDTSVIEDVKVNVSAADVTVEDDAKVTLPSGKTLTIGGTLSVEAGGEIEVSGTYVLAEGATVSNSGTVTIKDGGVSKSHDNDNDANGTGYTVVEPGGEVYFRENFFFGDEDSTDPLFTLGTGAKFSFNDTAYILDGKATFNGIENYGGYFGEGYKGFLLITAEPLKLKAESQLTIAADAILYMASAFTSSNQAIVAEGTIAEGKEPKVILKKDATLWHYKDFNFYDKEGNRFTDPTDGKKIVVFKETADTTYTWAANAGGTDKPGWKAEEEKGEDT